MLAALLALWVPSAHASPLDPATVYGTPEPAPGCGGATPPSDCTPPSDDTVVPAGWATAPLSVTLAGTDESPGTVTIEYAVDDGDVTQAPSGTGLPFDTDGVYAFSHRAIDVTGNASGWTLDTVMVDQALPTNTTAPIDPAPRAPGTITVTGGDATSGVAAVKWILDGGAEQSGPSGSQVTIDTDGPHSLRTWVVDVAGNESAPRDDTVTVDAIKPTDTTAISSAWRTTSPAVVTLTGTDGATSMEFRINGGTPQSTAVGGTVSFGADGVYTLEHRAVDGVGNRSDWVTDTVRLDATKPTNTTTASAAWLDPDQHVIVSGTDAVAGVADVQWQVDGGGIQTGASGSDVTVTGDGAHTVRTQVEDNAGNLSGWRTDMVRVDTLNPVDETAPPAGWSTAAVPVLVKGSDAGSGVASVEWSLDSGAVTTVAAASTTVTVSAEGEHTLRTRITDGLGHRTGWKSHTIRIDTTAPSNTTGALPDVWHSQAVPVQLTGADGGSGLDQMEWSVDAGPSTLGPSGTVVSVGGDGTHTLKARALDVAGNASGWRTDTIRIDSVKPTDSTTVAATVPYGTSATIAGSDALAGVDGVEWELDGVAGSGANSSQVPLGGAGAHTLRHRVIDNAGNASAWTQNAVTVDPSLNNDTTPPADTTAPPAGWRTASPVTVLVTATDGQTAVDHVEWRPDGGTPQSGPSGTGFTVAGEGTHSFETRAVDVAGNTSPWVGRTVKIDTVSPVDATAVPSWQPTRTVVLAGSDATSGVARMEWAIDGGATQTGPAGSVITRSADGTFQLDHRAVDAAGNVSAWRTDTVRIDTVKPQDTTPAAPAGWSTSAWTVTPAGTDDRSGVDEVQARLDGTPVADVPIVVDEDGEHTLETRVLDVAGNAGDWRTQTVKIDLQAPADTTPDAPTGWRAAPWTVTPSADDGAGTGVASIEWKLGAAGAVSTQPEVTIDAEGETVLMTRATDVAGHTSAWRSQTVRIDTAAPTVALDCGSGAWSAAPVACSVTAAGGPSGLDALTFSGAGTPAGEVAAGSTVTVGADGAWVATLHAVDGAGNEAQVTRTVRVDRTPPAADLRCEPAAAPTGYVCHAAGADATSGLASLLWRVDGGAWRAPAADGSFAVASGTVEVQAADRAGLRTVTPAAGLGVRVPPAPPAAPAAPAAPEEPAPAASPRVRTRDVAVMQRHRHGRDGLLGGFALRSESTAGRPREGSADVRPLSLGRGRYRIAIRLRSGQLTAKRVRIVRFKHHGGHTPRFGVALSGVKHRMHARLTVHRRRHGHWKRIAVTRARLKP